MFHSGRCRNQIAKHLWLCSLKVLSSQENQKQNKVEQHYYLQYFNTFWCLFQAKYESYTTTQLFISRETKKSGCCSQLSIQSTSQQPPPPPPPILAQFSASHPLPPPFLFSAFLSPPYTSSSCPHQSSLVSTNDPPPITFSPDIPPPF